VSELEIFARSRDLLGDDGFAALRGASVVIIGLGGVGSHALSALARAGVGRLRIVDFDQITWSSMGRLALAGPEDVGQNKAHALAARARALVGDVDIEPLTCFFDDQQAQELFGNEPPDLVIDAIDSLNPKTTLLQQCVERRLCVISSMGAAGRTDPTKIAVGDISTTRVCPLARAVRKRLRRRGIEQGIECVFSTEPAVQPLPPDDEPRLERGRVRNRLPNLAVMPGIFGYSCASLAIRRLSPLET
jgi:tRNA A37 threonylcarbamoyladenosine dehydratase